jgi:tetratricopeptide (TPR) repeat protein
MSWLDEHLRAIRNSPGPVVILAGREWGTYELIAEIGTQECPVLWLDFSGKAEVDTVAQGIRLSDAIRQTFGSPLFGYGVPVEHGLSILRKHAALLGPFIIALTAADAVPGLGNRLLTLCLEASVKLILSVQGPIPESWRTALHSARALSITPERLRLTRGQARELAGSEIGSRDCDRLLEDARGAFVPFLEMKYQLLGLPPPRLKGRSVGAPSIPDTLTSEEVFEILVRRQRWMEALELSVHEFPERVGEVVGQAGDLYFDQGLFDGLWRLLSRIPNAYRFSEEVLYWMFSAAIAVRKQEEVLRSVEDYLNENDAPELRALYAASGFARNPLDEAERAYGTKKSALTANFYGFVLATHSDPSGAITYLEEALDLFEKQENHHRVVSTAISICDAYINLGEYGNAASWAAWALKEFAERDLREELLRYHAIALLAYAKLLLGEVETGLSLLEPIELSDEIFGIPSMEAVVSTIGDYALVTGRPKDALKNYEIVFRRFGRRLGPYAVNDMVRALLHLGEVDRARSLANESVGLSAASNPYERQRALLACGTVEAAAAPHKAVFLLEMVLTHYEKALNAPALAQSGIHLAKAHLQQGDADRARHALSRASPGLRHLARSGWLLLGGPEEQFHEVWDLWNEDTAPVELRFMGGRKMRIQHRTRDYPLRWCEILAVLAFHPQGLNGEQLAMLLYGDGENMSTLKANVSRMRKDVPVSSRPYRIALPYTADFVELDKALREGRVREALELYHGPLLPDSESPFVVELREYLEETLRQAALNSSDIEVLLSLARKLGDDLELWEAASQQLSQNDPLLPLAKAHVKRIQRSWGVDG